MIKRMAEQWIIRVQGKDYGPADLATLHEWKADGRVLPANPARRIDVDAWQTAAEIPGLFKTEPPPVQVDDAAFIATSFPGFVELMRSLGGEFA